MNLNLSKLKEVGSSKNIKRQLEIPTFNFRNQEIETPYPFDLELNIYNTKDSFLLTGHLSGLLLLSCSRCLEKYQHRLQLEIEEELLKDELENFEKVDLIKILQENIMLVLPMKHLCSEECRGLCTVCGQNLNEKECNCKTESIDPRLAKLKDFYKKDDNEE